MYMNDRKMYAPARIAAILVLGSSALFAQTTPPSTPSTSDCSRLPSYSALKTALMAAQQQKNSGLGFNMWATVVNRDGYVCAVAFTGNSRGDQWPGSRVISAQKANTANAFSVPDFALSTANLYAATQNGGTLFGLQFSNPVDNTVAYAGNAAQYGQTDDPLVGKQIGGVNVFGGGLALYTPGQEAGWSVGRERRYLLHRSHHRLEGARYAESRQRAWLEWPAGRDNMINDFITAATRPAVQPQRLRTSDLRSAGDLHHGRAAGDQSSRSQPRAVNKLRWWTPRWASTSNTQNLCLIGNCRWSRWAGSANSE